VSWSGRGSHCASFSSLLFAPWDRNHLVPCSWHFFPSHAHSLDLCPRLCPLVHPERHSSSAPWEGTGLCPGPGPSPEIFFPSQSDAGDSFRQRNSSELGTIWCVAPSSDSALCEGRIRGAEAPDESLICHDPPADQRREEFHHPILRRGRHCDRHLSSRLATWLPFLALSPSLELQLRVLFGAESSFSGARHRAE
jgi:hypothetical protein